MPARLLDPALRQCWTRWKPPRDGVGWSDHKFPRAETIASCGKPAPRGPSPAATKPSLGSEGLPCVTHSCDLRVANKNSQLTTRNLFCSSLATHNSQLA